MKRLAIALVVAAAFIVGVMGSPADAARAEKTLICKQTRGEWYQQLVSNRSLENHLSKGSFLPGDPYPGETNYVFGPDCSKQAVPLEAAVVFNNSVECTFGGGGTFDYAVRLTAIGTGFDEWRIVGSGLGPYQPGQEVFWTSGTSQEPELSVSVSVQYFLDDVQVGFDGYSTTITNPCLP